MVSLSDREAPKSNRTDCKVAVVSCISDTSIYSLPSSAQ
jgi:hypothetical protein